MNLNTPNILLKLQRKCKLEYKQEVAWREMELTESKLKGSTCLGLFLFEREV